MPNLFRARQAARNGINGNKSSEETIPSSDQENQEENGQGEKTDAEHGDDGDEEQQSGPPTPVGFWDPKLKHVRHEAMTKWTITTAVLMVFILAVLSLYWACLFHVEQNLGSLVVYVVDFDSQAAPYNTTGGVQPAVGPLIAQLARQMVASPSPALGWEVIPPSAFAYDPIQVRQAIYDFDAWAAIIINPNATSMLYSAIQNGNASYDPMGACQMVYLQARDDTNYGNYILPMLNSFMTEATSMVGQQWAQMTMQSATTNASLVRSIAAAPQAISPAIGFSIFNLRPFYPTQSTPAVTIGLIYLIIISFFSFAFYLPIHFKVRPSSDNEFPIIVADKPEVPQTRRTPASQVSPPRHLAMVRHNLRVLHALAGLLLPLAGLPDQLRRRQSHLLRDPSHLHRRRLLEPRRLRTWHISRVLDDQLLRHDRPRPRM